MDCHLSPVLARSPILIIFSPSKGAHTMNNRLLRASVRLVVFCAFIATISLNRGDFVAYSTTSWDDSDYFDAVYACDGNYYGTLSDCRSNPSYPFNPDESQCRFNAGSSYYDCVSGIPSPTYELDFCAMARAARDNCNSQYGPEGNTPDPSAWGSCRSASGVDQCE